MGAFITLVKALPEVLALIKALQMAIEKAESERKVKDELQAINDAFASKDPAKLSHLFDSPP